MRQAAAFPPTGLPGERAQLLNQLAPPALSRELGLAIGDAVTLHLFQDRDTDVFAFTADRTGCNLPRNDDTEWVFLESMETIAFAWGEENFGEVYAAIDRDGFFCFFGERQPQPAEEAMTLRPGKTTHRA